MRATITQIGNSTGLIIPKEVAAKLNLKKGDTVNLSETRFGFAVSRYDAEVDQQIEAAKEGMAQYSNTLRKLAE